MFKILFYFLFHHLKNVKKENLLLALREQGPIKRAFRNFFITKNAWGMFHINSHETERDGIRKTKIGFSKKSAIKGAEKMSQKHGIHFSVYKCVFCDGYHIGKNKDNKTAR